MTTSRIRELAERHWNGEGDLVHAHHPVMPVERREAEELLDGVLYVKSVASITAYPTRATAWCSSTRAGRSTRARLRRGPGVAAR